MTPLPHTIPAEWLTAYYDGELDAARRERVKAHLAGCAECRRQLEEWSALNEALAADKLPQERLTSPAAFWRGVQARLPEQRPAQPAPTPVSVSRVLLRWSPGIGLLLLNGALQVAAVAGVALMLVPARLWAGPAWAGWAYSLAADSSLGWLAWVVPSGWSWVGVSFLSLTISAGLAVVYLAWLGYEWRYGAARRYGQVPAAQGG